jgi:glutathione S-transferase
MTPNITLYQANGSCAIATHILLNHLAIPYTRTRMVGAPGGGHAGATGSPSAEEYLAIHPKGYVPAMTVDGTNITESPATLAFVLAVAGRDDAATPLERARAAEWLAWLSGTVHAQGFGMFWRPVRFTDDETMYDGIKAKGKKVIDASMERIDHRLKGWEFAVGDEVGPVDFYLYVFWRWGLVIGIDMKGKFPEYARVMKRVEELDSVKKTLELEELKPTF